MIALQIFLAITAPTAVYLLGHGHRKSACVIGLCSQVGFFLLFGLCHQWIMWLPCVFYTISWISNWREKMTYPNNFCCRCKTKIENKQERFINAEGPYCIECATKHDEIGQKPTNQTRQFSTGATRNTDTDKLDYEGFLSPIVLQRFAIYMHKHRKQSDGQLRNSDNWQKGIPLAEYIKSGWRHFVDWWLEHRGHKSREGVQDALCGLIFNACGYLYEILKAEGEDDSISRS